MSPECKYCKRELRKGEGFILEGNYPGAGRRYVEWFFWSVFLFGLDTYGDLYHKACYLKKDSDRARMSRIIKESYG
jgi:hypothetical protein